VSHLEMYRFFHASAHGRACESRRQSSPSTHHTPQSSHPPNFPRLHHPPIHFHLPSQFLADIRVAGAH
jgi:hypothetical protein